MVLKYKKQKFNAAQLDLIAVVCIVGLTYALCITFEVAERFTDWAAPLEAYQVDELPLVFLVMGIAAVWFSRRRMRELANEITLRTRAEQSAQENLKMFQTLFIEGLSGNFIVDMRGDVTLCNEAFRTMSGMAVNASTEFNLARALGSGQWYKLLQELRHTGCVDFSELQLKRPDHGAWVVMARFQTPRSSAGENPEIHGYFTDITEQHLAEKELAALLNENRVLTGYALQMQEEERRHLAREIHDDLGQYLTAIRLDASSMLKSTSDAAAAAHTERIISHAEHIQLSIKRIISKLRPAALDAHGLIEAVHCLVHDWHNQSPEINCSTELDATCSQLEEPVSIIVYRIVQEALTNITRHARASNVHIAIHRIHTNDLVSLLVEIQDDGIGFKPRKSQNSFGLSGMRERVESVKGTFRLVSGQNAGVLISAKIPLTPVKRIAYVESTAG